MDSKVNGQIQTEWSWLIAIYLFLGGVGAGAYTIGAINGFAGEELQLSTTVGSCRFFVAPGKAQDVLLSRRLLAHA